MAGKSQKRKNHPANNLPLPFKFISLTRGMYAKVDADLFDYLNRWTWTANKTKAGCYAVRRFEVFGGSKIIYLHRHVWRLVHGEIPDGMTIDHAERDTLDCRVGQLRLATRQQQNQNRRSLKRTTSGYIGVTLERRRWKAYAYTQVDGKKKRTHLGSFDDPFSAAWVRDEWIKVHYGKFASLNNLTDRRVMQFPVAFERRESHQRKAI